METGRAGSEDEEHDMYHVRKEFFNILDELHWQGVLQESNCWKTNLRSEKYNEFSTFDE